MAGYDLSHAVWRTSSYSGQNESCVEVAVLPAWQTSTYSGQNGNCVEVARNVPGWSLCGTPWTVAVRR
jgi:hypothetical protein